MMRYTVKSIDMAGFRNCRNFLQLELYLIKTENRDYQ